MEFRYTPHETDVGVVFMPTVPISFNGFPIGHALVDTGADITLLPMDIRNVLSIEIDHESPMEIGSAGGGTFKAFPSRLPIEYCLEHSGFRPICWKGIAFFAPRQPIILLGQYQCLERLHLELNAPEKMTVIRGIH